GHLVAARNAGQAKTGQADGCQGIEQTTHNWVPFVLYRRTGPLGKLSGQDNLPSNASPSSTAAASFLDEFPIGSAIAATPASSLNRLFRACRVRRQRKTQSLATVFYRTTRMDAVLLCAGLGTRLRPHTLTTPKPLLSVQGRPILDWTLGALPRQVSRVIV